MSKIGDRIKKLRIEHNMTQEELGALLGVKKSAVQKYESGEVVNLTADKIKVLCSTFKVYPRDFIFETDEEYFDAMFDASGKYTHQIPGKIETRIIEDRFGLTLLHVMVSMAELNKDGQKKVADYISDIKKIEEYLSVTDPES